MWVTCHECCGQGIISIEKNNNITNKKEYKEKNCRVCERYRITGENYEFYGHIWIDEDYEVSTPPNSP